MQVNAPHLENNEAHISYLQERQITQTRYSLYYMCGKKEKKILQDPKNSNKVEQKGIELVMHAHCSLHSLNSEEDNRATFLHVGSYSYNSGQIEADETWLHDYPSAMAGMASSPHRSITL